MGSFVILPDKTMDEIGPPSLAGKALNCPGHSDRKLLVICTFLMASPTLTPSIFPLDPSSHLYIATYPYLDDRS